MHRALSRLPVADALGERPIGFSSSARVRLVRRVGWASFVLLLAISGCRLHRVAEPVSRSLVQCRQLSQQGLRACEQNDLPRAEALLARAVEACPVDAEARRRYAKVLWQRNKQEQAMSQLEEALRISSEDAELLAHAAEMRLSLGENSLAGELADRAIDFDPKNPSAWAARGRVRRRQGKLHEALADFHRVLGLEPEHRGAMQEIAEVYQELHRPQQALAAWQLLCDTYAPGEEPQRLLYRTGLAYSAVGRATDAVECLRSANRRGPADCDLLFHLADAEFRAGQREEAWGSAQQALQLKPGHPGSLALLERLEVARVAPGVRPR